MVGLRIYDSNFTRVALRPPVGKRIRTVSVAPNIVVPGKQFMDSGNLFEILPTTERTGFFAAALIAATADDWTIEPLDK